MSSLTGWANFTKCRSENVTKWEVMMVVLDWSLMETLNLFLYNDWKWNDQYGYHIFKANRVNYYTLKHENLAT